MNNDKENLNSGHRERMRSKIISGNKLFDYELLEIILFNVFPRKDVKPIAKNLINKFGSLSKVFFADYRELKNTNDIGDSTIAMIFTIRDVIKKILDEEANNKNSTTFTSIKDIVKYLRIKIGQNKKESLCILYLDKNSRLIHEEVNESGTIDRIAIYNREILKKALEVNATNIILSHNHPTGNPKPSKADIMQTNQLKDSANQLGIMLLDHIIVTDGADYYSFYNEAMI